MPKEIDGAPVSKVGKMAFSGCTIGSLIIGDSVKTICHSAFMLPDYLGWVRSDWMCHRLGFGMPVAFKIMQPFADSITLVRDYKVLGKASLIGGDWQHPTNSTHRFFKVSVEMP